MINTHHTEPLEPREVIPHPLVLIDGQSRVIAVSGGRHASDTESNTAVDRVAPGVNLLDVYRRAAASSAIARQALAGMTEVLNGNTESFSMDYAIHTNSARNYFRMSVTGISYGKAQFAVSHTDITDLHHSKENDFKRLQDFAHRLISAQEKERRRISREIHDDVGNRLALMSISVRRAIQQASKNVHLALDELHRLSDGIVDLSKVLRDLSHGLHPGTLRHLGVGPALKSLLDVFKETYDIHVDVVIPSRMTRLPDDVELCIFRIAQECLQNVVKHSGANQLSVILTQTANQTRLIISDTGRGFVRTAANRSGGLGLLSMEERALSIGAHLTVNSSPSGGTEVQLTVPFERQLAEGHT